MPIFGSPGRKEEGVKKQEPARKQSGFSPVCSHPWVLSPRQPMSPMGTAASTCRCVPEPVTSSSRAQHSHVAFSTG